MTRAHLIACPSCTRHTRADELTCPFCKSELGEAARASAPRVAPAQRLSRAALYAFGVGSLAVVTSCGGSIAGESEGKTSSGDDAGHIADGAVDDSRVTARVDAQSSPDVTNFTVPYGVPPPFDAGLKVDANVEVGDADERPDVFCCIPVYGGPSGG